MGSSKVFAGFSNSKNTFDIGLEVAQGYNTKVAMLGCRVSVSYGLTQSCNMASLSWCVMIYYKLVMTLTRENYLEKNGMSQLLLKAAGSGKSAKMHVSVACSYS